MTRRLSRQLASTHPQRSITSVASGFTLIEVMTVMAIAGILAAVAIPNYSRYITRGYLVEATNALSDYRLQMEKAYQNNRTYLVVDEKGGEKDVACAAPVPTNLATFTISCVVEKDSTGYTATATGAGSTAGFVYTIDYANRRATPSMPSDWTMPGNAAVTWVMR